MAAATTTTTTTMMDHLHTAYPESPQDGDEASYPCKGCGEILEEGKAFELAGNRWHIDCFRCNTCNTLLDSDANLLLLGDGSLICNNCTYSCSSCGNKIEDLAILTGDQAFCANCFKCRNCKRKIENLRYARTSQGIFCMDCHEALMARRRKKTAKGTTSKAKNANTEKSLPAIPPPNQRHTAYVPNDPAYIQELPGAMPDVPSISNFASELRTSVDDDTSRQTVPQDTSAPTGLTLPSTIYRDNRRSVLSQSSALSGAGEEFLIPLAFDPNPPKQTTSPSSVVAATASASQTHAADERSKENVDRSDSRPKQSSISSTTSPFIPSRSSARQASVDHTRKQSDTTPSRIGSGVTSPVSNGQQSPAHISYVARGESGDTFQLQEAPRARKPLSGSSTPRAEITLAQLPLQQSPGLASREVKTEVRATPRRDYDSSPTFTDGASSPQPVQNVASMLANLPKRGDSLERPTMSIPRKELGSGSSVPKISSDLSNTTTPRGDLYTSPSLGQPFQPAMTEPPKVNGKTISAPLSPSTASRGIYDVPAMSQDETSEAADKFVDPRMAPVVPIDRAHARDESISTLHSEAQKSPRLPRYSAGGDFTLEEDISRILGIEGEPTASESFLRRVSNSVRHGRSHSDRSAGRFSRDKWPRSPVVASSLAAHDISSPTTSSPENREELAWFKNELRRERQKNSEREKKISELEAQLNATAEISEVNVQLREKRSTMVVLDSQKEIVVRELEVLTDHIANAKKSGEQLDMGKMHNSILRELAESLQKLKASFTPQIESLVQQRNSLMEEITNLTSTKDKSFQEFEQLSIKNAQLAEFNNQLVDQIQNIYKTNSGQPMPDLNKPSGLGIYQHQKDKSQVSIDMRDARPLETPPITDIGTTYETGDAAVQSLGGAQVVEMKKGAVAKRFDWKRGQKMAKGITKGVKGAFASAQQNYGRDMQFAETGAYAGPTLPGQEYGGPPRNNSQLDPSKQGWFAGKPPGNKNGLYAHSNNASTPSLLTDVAANVPLFGTDLEIRCEFEKNTIPGIVKRCIAEVEHRGMDVEGIYRKSGGNSQVQQVKEGFEKQPSDFDVSDADLDIHAVTSGLKQYFRKLPNPLITYEVYDLLIDLTRIPESPHQQEQRIEGLRSTLVSLPKTHYETLTFLMQHLSRVVALEKENLMTPMNIAVVFAPTIMRPESVARELNDTKAKTEVVMWMVEDCEKIFK